MEHRAAIVERCRIDWESGRLEDGADMEIVDGGLRMLEILTFASRWTRCSVSLSVVFFFRSMIPDISAVPQQNRQKIYQYLFQEGVLVAKKDFNAPKHTDIDVPNLQVIKALQSMESRGLVAVRFSWQYYYYYLTDSGIEYLRKYLHLPTEIVPRTHIKTSKASGMRPGSRP
ncbi:hypothetical protein HK101_001223, partial [Irineochytrium annulatum]